MKQGFILSTMLLMASLTFGQWQQLASPEVYHVRFLVKHHDKAYAGIEGVLCAGDRESQDRYAFYPVDINSTNLRCAASWGDYFITGNSSSVVSVYSDVSIAQKLITKPLAAGTITSVVAKDNIVLAGTYNGIYRSADTLKNMPLVSPTELKGVNQLSITGAKWYAATDKGVFSSMDQGASWQINGLSNTIINSIEFSADTVYAATNSGLYISDDNGQNWKVHPEFSQVTVMKLILHEDILFINTVNGLYKKSGVKPMEPAFLGLAGEYTGVIQLGRTSVISSFWGMVFRDDQGTWNPIMTPVAYEARVQTFAGNENVLLAGTDTRGLFASFDRGNTWIMRSPPFDFGAVYGISSAYIVDGYWFSSTLNGIYRSSDEGTTWIMKNNGLPEDTRTNSYFKQDDRLYICTNKGLYFTTNYGDTWQLPSNGINVEVYQIAKNKAAKLFAGSASGLYEAFAPYDLWTLASFQPLNPFSSLASFNDTMYASTRGSGVFQSSDGGAIWNGVTTGLKNQYLGKVVTNDSHAVAVNGLGDIYIKLHKENMWNPFNHNLELYSSISALMIINDTVYVSGGFDGVHKRALIDHNPVLGIKPAQSKDRKKHLYPNPASDVLHFRSHEQIRSIEIVDQYGKIILKTEISANLTIEDLQSGWYYVKMYWKDETVSIEKFIKL